MNETCAKWGKVVYDTQQEAASAAHAATARRDGRKLDRMRPYLCDQGHWHIGHSPGSARRIRR